MLLVAFVAGAVLSGCNQSKQAETTTPPAAPATNAPATNNAPANP